MGDINLCEPKMSLPCLRCSQFKFLENSEKTFALVQEVSSWWFHQRILTKYLLYNPPLVAFELPFVTSSAVRQIYHSLNPHKCHKVAASHCTDKETFQMRKWDAQRFNDLPRVGEWQNQGSNLDPYEPRAHDLYPVPLCLQIKPKSNPRRGSCFHPSLRNDKNMPRKVMSQHQGLWMKRTKKWNYLRGCGSSFGMQKTLSKRQSILERSGHEVFVTTELGLPRPELHACHVQWGLDRNGHCSFLPSSHAFLFPYTCRPCWVLSSRSFHMRRFIWPSSYPETDSPHPLTTPENWSASICKQYFPPNTSMHI